MNNKNVKSIIHVCLFCKCEFTIKHYSHKNPKYCSIRCQHNQRMLESNNKFDDGGIKTSDAQRRILSERYGYQCNTCNITEWNSQPIMLQVDHIDGNSDNNKGENLRLLCPNCHSQTPTYKGGNKKTPKTDRRSTRNRLAYASKNFCS